MRSKRLGQTVCIISLLYFFIGCSGGGGDNSGGGTPPPATTGTVSLDVSGTTVSVFAGDDLVASDNTQGKTGPDIDTDRDGILDAYRLTLRNIPLNRNLRIYLESKGAVYPLYFGATNVFSLSSDTPFNFGFVAAIKGAAGNTATPANTPCAASGVQCAGAIASVPAALTIPDTSGLSIDQLNTNGLNALNEISILKARTYFEAAEQLAGTEASNRADTARFFYAATTVLAFGFDRLTDNTNNGLNNLGDILDSFGMNATDDVRINANQYPIPTLSMPSNASTGADLQAFAVSNILPEIIRAKTAANRISTSFNVDWTEPVSNEVVESDYGDALLCRAALDAILSTLYAQAAYNLDSDLDEKANNNQTVQQFLAANTSFGVIQTGAAANLTQSKAYANSALVNFRSAILEMESEIDTQSNDYVSLADLTAPEIAQAKLDIADALASLNGPTVVSDNEIPATGNGFTLNMSPFFAGSIGNIRTLLPAFNGNNVASVFPDPTMGGVLPGGEINLNEDINTNNIPDILEDSGLSTLPFTGWPYP
jgi:hypothetical protein